MTRPLCAVADCARPVTSRHARETRCDRCRIAHGGPRLYNAGCRCDLCRAWKAEQRPGAKWATVAA